jgi:uncharacterized protein
MIADCSIAQSQCIPLPNAADSLFLPSFSSLAAVRDFQCPREGNGQMTIGREVSDVSWLTKVALGKSLIHGIGVFALEPIKRGTKVWTVDSSMKFMNPSELAALPPDELRFALLGGYFHHPSQSFIYYNDGMEYMNHAQGRMANIGAREWPPLREDHCIALRDIAAGEELLEDYKFWSSVTLRNNGWIADLYRKFCPKHYSFLLKIEQDRLRKTA